MDEQAKSAQRAEGVRLLSESHSQEVEVEDPTCEQFYSSWCTIAAKNADIYEKVFGGRIVPTDRVLNYTQLRSYRVRCLYFQGTDEKEKEGGREGRP